MFDRVEKGGLDKGRGESIEAKGGKYSFDKHLKRFRS